MRHKQLLIYPELFAEFLKAPRGGWLDGCITADVPDDLKIVYADWKFESNTIRLIVESEMFPLTPQGAELPYFEPTFTRVLDTGCV